MKLVSASTALNLIGKLAENGVRILGVDGFILVKEGYVASLDMILDLSTSILSSEEAAKQAMEFVKQHASEEVVFEVVPDD